MPDPLNLTPKQMRILNMINTVRTTRGYSPTMQELADALGVSKVTVFEHVEALIKKGCLVRQKNKARSLEVAPSLQLPDETSGHRLPLVGTIAAGSPIDAVEDREHLDLDSIFCPPGMAGTGRLFVLRVRGDSMKDEHIREGDYVVCEKTDQARNGQTVVALLDSGEATLKKLFKERDGRIRLQPANEAYEPIWVEPHEVTIQGVLIGLLRTY